jgi:regulator of sigma E protease
LGDLGIFLYYLIWWLILVNVSVAVMNMIPVGIFDGGRFFYLTIWGITGKEKAGEIAYRITTWAFLALVAAMMVKWAFVIW